MHGSTWVKIQRQGIVETKGAMKVLCKKQEIEGITIPSGFEIWLPGQNIESVKKSFSHIAEIDVPDWKMNEILKMLYLNQIRDVKN